jgi:D-aminoacyl-tRNA deacylase
MRIVIQRVSQAQVNIQNQTQGSIGQGFLILLGISTEDTEADIDVLINKVSKLRVFNDEAGKMNLSIRDINGEILVLSQFTLFADTQKGNRPSFIQAARPEQAIPLYESFVLKLSKIIPKPIQTGIFGADMQVSLTNDGPVTILIDTKNV